MNPRDEALAEIAEWKAVLAGLPPVNRFDGYTWQNGERDRVRSLDLATLVDEFEAAELRDIEEQKRKLTLECLRERMGAEHSRFAGFIRDHIVLVEGELRPAGLAAAFSRLENDIKADESLLTQGENEVNLIEWRLRDTQAREKAGWTMRPNSPAVAEEVIAAKARLTPLRARLTRIRAAQSKLRALTMTSGDISKATMATLDELHKANMAADFSAMAAEPVAAAKPLTEAEYLRAHGVTEGIVAELE